MKLMTLTLSLLFISSSIFAYQKTIPIEEYTLEELFLYTNKEPNKGFQELLSRYSNAIEQNDSLAVFQTAQYLARYGYLTGNTRLSDKYKRQVDSLSDSYPGLKLTEEYRYFLVSYAIISKKIPDALKYLNAIRPQIFEAQDTGSIIKYHCLSARAYAQIDDHSNALMHLYNAEKLNNNYRSKALQASIHTAYSAVYWEQRKTLLSYENDRLAVKYYEQSESFRDLLPAYLNLMSKAMQLQRKEEALEYARKYREVKSQFNSEVGTFTQELNQIFFYIQLNEFELAKEQALSTIELASKIGRDSSHAIYLLGITYRGLENYDEAAYYIEKAYQIARELNHAGKSSFYSHALYQTYYWKDKYEPALDWYKTYISFRDSVYNEKKATEIAVYESRLEAIKQKRKRKQIEAQAEIKKQENRVLWISIILGTLLAGFVFFSQSQRTKKRQLQQESLLLKSQMEKDKLQQELNFKKREITGHILHMTKSTSTLQKLKNQIINIKQNKELSKLPKIIRQINLHLDDNEDWDQFLTSFKEVQHAFLKKLHNISDKLTSNDIRIASLMRMNISSKEIAVLLNITINGVKKARYRLRKKLKVDSNINLQKYLLDL